MVLNLTAVYDVVVLVKAINKLFEKKNSKVRIAYVRIDTENGKRYCIKLYRNNKAIAYIGGCVKRSQLWRLTERLAAIKTILEEADF